MDKMGCVMFIIFAAVVILVVVAVGGNAGIEAFVQIVSFIQSY